MTSQTKHYIEMADLLSLRCDCKDCGASLSLPLAKEIGNALSQCPRCKSTWAGQSSEHLSVINTFANKIGELKFLAKTSGLRLYLEISSSDRVFSR
jgi:uncharacterized paraquat-inducible protein A